ncbi:hypothetical protein [Lysinibacillus sp. JNUCC 51]|uniref:hypothetical protein n=1 Tax=Lysinibacillus sp. JNUCC-51 TaxID=2792479 RepID=UPI003081C5C2
MNIGIISTIGLMALLDTLSPAVFGVTIFILLRNKKGESRLLSVVGNDNSGWNFVYWKLVRP